MRSIKLWGGFQIQRFPDSQRNLQKKPPLQRNHPGLSCLDRNSLFGDFVKFTSFLHQYL